MKKVLKLKTVLFLTVSSISITSLACGSIGTPAAPPNQVETIVAGTLQALTPLVSPTVPITANPPALAPTLTSTPISSPAQTTQPPANAGTQIAFPTGATYGVVEGTIEANQTLDYFLRAAEGQPMIVIVNSPNNDVTMSIHGQDGTLLLPASQERNIWQGKLPKTQNYYFQVIGGASTQPFTLSVNIPARVQFATGTNSSRLSGRTVNGYAVSYVLYAFAGQTLEAMINNSPNDAGLTIWGFDDGQPYSRAQNGITNFSMELPSTQDYIIEVVPQGGRVIDYTLTVRIQ